jgi:hypothetical protein
VPTLQPAQQARWQGVSLPSLKWEQSCNLRKNPSPLVEGECQRYAAPGTAFPSPSIFRPGRSGTLVRTAAGLSAPCRN